MSSRAYRWTATATVLTALLTTACTNTNGGGVSTQSLGTTPTPTASPTSTIDPRAQAAVSAYEAFGDAATTAQRHPVARDQEWPAGADFTKTSFDPLKTQYMSYIWSLQAQGVEYRGTPDTPHISVKSIHLDATPWPTVLLTDCQTGGDWDEYSIKTGKRIPSADNAKVPPPYLITAKMIYFDHRWGVQSTTADKSRTCTTHG